jgi:hypothetical protein
VLLNNAEKTKLASDPSMKDLLLSSMPSTFGKRRRSEAFVRSKMSIVLLL